MGKIVVEQVRSVIGRPYWQRAIVKGLGLRRIRHKVVLPDTPSVRGMIRKVPHLVKIVEERRDETS